MPLQFDIYAIVPEDFHEPFSRPQPISEASGTDRMRQRPLFASGKTNKTIGVRKQVFFADRCRSFRRTQLALRQKPAKILVSGAVKGENGKQISGRERDLGANVRTYTGFFPGQMKTRRAVNT